MSKLLRLRTRQLKTILVILLSTGLNLFILHAPATGRAEPVALDLTTPAVVSVYSDTYASSNVTDTNLTPGSTVTFEVRVDNAPPFNGYEFWLYYDSKFLNATGVDLTSGTVFNAPFAPAQTLDPGVVRLAVVNLGSAYYLSSGTLAHVSFKVRAVGVSPLTLAAGMSMPSFAAQGFTELVLAGTPLETTTADGYFKNVSGKSGPVSSFSLFNPTPIRGERVVFNATTAFDSDNDTGLNRGISLYTWDFGDGETIGTRFPMFEHRYNQLSGFGGSVYGNFSARLTVSDDNGFEAMKAMKVSVSPVQPPLTNFIVGLIQGPFAVQRGTTFTSSLNVLSTGNFTGTVSFTAQVSPQAANMPTVILKPPEVTINATQGASSTLAILTTVNTPIGYYGIILTATSGQLSNSFVILAQVTGLPTNPPLQPAFVRGGVSWIHHLSFIASSGNQVWTSKVNNPNPNRLIIDVEIAGFSDSGSSSFVADSGPVVLRPGETDLNIQTIFIFTPSDIGQSFDFTARILYEAFPVGSILESSSAKSGSFRIVS